MKKTSYDNGDTDFNMKNYPFYKKSKEDLENICFSDEISSIKIELWLDQHQETWDNLYKKYNYERLKLLEEIKRENEEKERNHLLVKDANFRKGPVMDFKRAVGVEDLRTIEPFITEKRIDEHFRELGCEPNYGFSGFNYGFQGYVFLDYEPLKFKDQMVIHKDSFYLRDTQRTLDEYIPWTPLQYVCACGRINMAKELVRRGASIWITDKFGKTAADIAYILNHRNITEYLEGMMKKDLF